MTTQELKQYIDRVLGNNLRCLLPSYWWKRLFNQVADRIDDKQDILVSGKNIKTINGKELLGEGDTNADIIINSVDELNALDLPTGSRASVVTGGPVLGSIKDCVESNDETQWTRVSGVQINAFPDFSLLSADVNEVAIYFYEGTSLPLYIIARKDELGSIMGAVRMSTSETIYLSLNGVDISQDAVDKLNGWLKTGDYKVAVYDGLHDMSDLFDSFIKFYIYHPTISDVYVKADSWERLAKESDLEGIEGGSGEDKTLTFYAPIDDVSLSDAEKQHNAESYQKVAESFESDTYYDIKVLLSTTQLVALDVIKTINPAIDNGRLKLTFGGVGSGIDLQMLTVTSDGSATITIEGIEESGVELRDLYIYENYDGTLTELTEEQKAWNLETLKLAKQGKAIVQTTLHGNTFILELFNEDNDYQFGYTQFSPSGGVAISVGVTEDGLSGIKIEETYFDSELSTTSINAVQNKAVTEALSKTQKAVRVFVNPNELETLIQEVLADQYHSLDIDAERFEYVFGTFMKDNYYDLYYMDIALVEDKSEPPYWSLTERWSSGSEIGIEFTKKELNISTRDYTFTSIYLFHNSRYPDDYTMEAQRWVVPGSELKSSYTAYVDEKVGDINSILDSINEEVI